MLIWYLFKIVLILMVLSALLFISYPFYAESKWWCARIRKHGRTHLIEVHEGIGKLYCRNCHTIFLKRISFNKQKQTK